MDSKSIVPKGRVGSTPTRGTFAYAQIKKSNLKNQNDNVKFKKSF